MAIKLTDNNFSEIVAESDVPVLVDFEAEWCSSCRAIEPVIEEVSKEYEGRLLVGRVNIDHNPVLSNYFGIKSIPTLLIFKNGKIIDKQIGATSKAVLESKLKGLNIF